MRFPDLLVFVTTRMKMSHIYQPLLMRALIDAGGTATLRQLVHVFLAQDESQLRFYEKRIKEMPLRVLTKHGLLRHEGQRGSLMVEDLTGTGQKRGRRMGGLKGCADAKSSGW